MGKMLFSIILSVILIYSCSEPTGNSEYIEPELVHIDKNLDVILVNAGKLYHKYDDFDTTLYSDITPYYIGKYELTNEEYSKFVADGGYDERKYWTDEGWKVRSDSNWTKPALWDSDQLDGWKIDPYSNESNTPVHCISFYEAEAYCKWLSIKTGKDYHIPTTPQWVRAAKGPLPGNTYPWGNEFEDGKALYTDLPCLEWGKNLAPVDSYPQGRSEDGCYHMIGNVQEFVYCSMFFPDIVSPVSIRSKGEFSCYSRSDCGYSCITETMTNDGYHLIEKESSGLSSYMVKKSRYYYIGVRICLN